jgi:Icc-related predicted phosphoesterase
MPKGTHFTFASLGDLHMREENASSFRDLFAKVSKEASALVLCGDLTDTGTVKQAELLAEELGGCSIPVVAVLGNHDYECGHAEDVKTVLTSGGVHLLDGQSCQVDGVSFIGVKGFAGGFGSRMLSSFGEPATKTFVAEAISEAMRLENALRTAKGPRAVVVLHYSPIAETTAANMRAGLRVAPPSTTSPSRSRSRAENPTPLSASDATRPRNGRREHRVS